MAHKHNRLAISTSDGQILKPLIDHSKSHIPAGFTYAEVKDDGKDSQWILYPTADFNKSEGTATYKPFMISAKDGKMKFDQGNILSASVYNNADPGIVIFEHPKFGGNYREYYEDAEATGATPDKPWVGASAIIVTGGEWQLYGKLGQFPGTYKVGQYPSLHSGVDDHVVEIKLVQQ